MDYLAGIEAKDCHTLEVAQTPRLAAVIQVEERLPNGLLVRETRNPAAFGMV